MCANYSCAVRDCLHCSGMALDRSISDIFLELPTRRWMVSDTVVPRSDVGQARSRGLVILSILGELNIVKDFDSVIDELTTPRAQKIKLLEPTRELRASTDVVRSVASPCPVALCAASVVLVR